MNTLSQIDLHVLELFYNLRIEPVTAFFMRATDLGRDVYVVAFMILISVALFTYKKYAEIAGLWVSILGSGATALALKVLIHRPRPSALFQAYSEGPYYSFPSGHATLAMALYGFCVYILLQMYPTAARRVMFTALPFIVALVAVSRLYLGVHYLSDVLAGLILGAIFVWIGIQVRLYVLMRLDSRRV